VYVWADGVYSGLRAEQTKLCALVVIGVTDRGEKRLLAIEDGARESTQSWREVLLKLKARGIDLPPDIRPLVQVVLHTSGGAQSPQELAADSPRHGEAEPDDTCAASLQS